MPTSGFAAPDRASPPRAIPRRRRSGVRSRLLRWYFAAKYRLFRRERRPNDGRRGLIVLQIDALPYTELRRAIELGYCPTLSQMVREEDHTLRRWFCGLPSATPYCQAGIFYGNNEGIPAFRFYDRAERRVVTCNAPAGVQYIRDRINAPLGGALAGGSSYVNLFDGDAQTVAFTIATREKMSVYQRLGATRMVLLILLHPIRLLRMFVQSIMEWVREDVERTIGELSRRRTHSEGLFPFVRIFTNVVVRELQTMAVLLDVYLGVPVIYTTFMQYDELAHHFGPSSWQALRDLRRIDARVREIRRMIEAGGGREYDLVVLSDHGMTPAASYRVLYGESLGRTVDRILAGDAKLPDEAPIQSVESYARTSEYSVMTPQILETMAELPREEHQRTRRTLRKVSDWIRSRYGLRELIMPEKYYVGEEDQVIVTYSSCLAHVYFTDSDRRRDLAEIAKEPSRAHLYASLLAHPGIGLLAAMNGPTVHLETPTGRGLIVDGHLEVLAGDNPLEHYGTEPPLIRAIEHLVRQHNSGDLVIFGEYDGYEIVSFDDQIGAHGSAGGQQLYPFLIAPQSLGVATEVIEDARDIYRVIMRKYMQPAS
jgi:hypothetical protein